MTGKKTRVDVAARRTADDLLAERAEYWPEAVTPIAQLMMRAFRFSGLVLNNARRQVAAYGLTLTEFEVLASLRGVAPPHELVPTDLYSAILISSGGLTKVLHALEARKLISRGSGQADKRSKPIRLTAKGRALAERAMADLLRSDAELIGRGLSATEIGRLTGLLRKALVKLEPDEPP